jgi:hypothetical protein
VDAVALWIFGLGLLLTGRIKSFFVIIESVGGLVWIIELFFDGFRRFRPRYGWRLLVVLTIIAGSCRQICVCWVG